MSRNTIWVSQVGGLGWKMVLCYLGQFKPAIWVSHVGRYCALQPSPNYIITHLCYLGIIHWGHQPSSNRLFGYNTMGGIGLFSPVQTILFSCIMDGGLFSPRKGMSRLGKSFQNKLRAKKAYCFHKATPNQVENIT